MSVVISGATLGLAWFAATNLLLSTTVWALTRYGRLEDRALGWPALFALRLLPAGGAALFTLAVVVPAHWLYEPRGVEETYAAAVWLLGAAGAAIVGAAAARAMLAVRASSRVRRAWGAAARRESGPTEIEGLRNLALAGIVRPRVCIGRPVRRVLTDAELAVAVDHEYAHLWQRDNLKRFVIAAAPDLLCFTREGRQLEDAWAAQAECQADARAVRGDAGRAVDLASALLKVARLTETSAGGGVSPAWSTLHQRSLLDVRVRRLVSGTIPPAVEAPVALPGVCAAALAATAVAWWAGAGLSVHLLTERLIRLLP